MVAGVTRRAARVFGGDDLGEILRFGNVRLMTANTKHGGVQLCWLDRSRIIGMLGKSSMASLAGYSLMHTFAFHLEDVSMTALADLMAGI